MIIYEVNLSISNTIKDNFKEWLKKHAELMITFPGFLKFSIYELSSEDKNKFNLCVHYNIKSEFYFENYLTNHSVEMQDEAIDLFGKQFTATRRILKLCD